MGGSCTEASGPGGRSSAWKSGWAGAPRAISRTCGDVNVAANADCDCDCCSPLLRQGRNTPCQSAHCNKIYTNKGRVGGSCQDTWTAALYVRAGTSAAGASLSVRM